MKLYQNALKLHSQGPDFYDAAEGAYNELFRSEIFTWEESLSEAQAIERYRDIEASDDDSDDALAPVLVAPVTAADGMPSSLPQILYLAYKNHGQFLLDRLRQNLSRIEHEVISDASVNVHGPFSDVASSSLKLFVEALDRDDTDLELWRLVSRIGSFLGSVRIARYCLEAVLDSDGSNLYTWTEPFGLEVGFAKERLKPILEKLDDQLSQSQVSSLSGKHGSIISSFRKRIDPCPYLPTPSPSPDNGMVKTTTAPQVIEVPLRSYTSCGRAILLKLGQEVQGVDEPDPGSTYLLALPTHQSTTPPGPSSKTLGIGDMSPVIEQPPLVDEQGPMEDASKVENGAIAVAMPGVVAHAVELSPTDLNRTTLEGALASTMMADGLRSSERETLEVVDIANHAENAQISLAPVISASLPTRKRSSETAELPDSADIGRSRSKRIKAKGSLDPDALKDSTADDWAKWYEQQLQIYHQADDVVFDAVGTILSKLGSDLSTSLSTLREIVSIQITNPGLDRANNPFQSVDLVAHDLRSTLDVWDLARSKAFLNGHDYKDPAGGIGGSRNPAFAAFLENSNQSSRRPSKLESLLRESEEHALESFISRMEKQEWISLNQLAYQWLEELLIIPIDDRMNAEGMGWYETYIWPDMLKEGVVQMLVFQDQAIYTKTNKSIEQIEQQDYQLNQPAHKLSTVESLLMSVTEIDGAKRKYTKLVQIIFELHLDVYGLITKPNSKVDEATRVLQRDRLRRWAAIASKLMNQWTWPDNTTGRCSKAMENLQVRFMWASVVCNSLLEPTSRDNTILCYHDLIHTLQGFDKKNTSLAPFKIELPNNAIMPEISVEAAQKEISRLTTMDFFMGAFNPGNTDPLTTIESLEPLLDLSIKDHTKPADQDGSAETVGTTLTAGSTEASPTYQTSDMVVDIGPDTKLLEALAFLKEGNVALRLFLWQKLRDAYRAIVYPPQVLSCDLRMVALIMDHLSALSYREIPQENRRDSLLRWLHRLDDHVTRVLTIALSKSEAFDCLDSDHLRTSLEAVTSLQKLLHVFALWEDTIRVGKTPPPAQVNQNATRGLARSTDRFRDMIVRTWTLQYILLKEAMSQNSDFFESPPQEMIKHLERVHQALGLRCYCSLASKTFLRLMKKELETFKVTGGWDIDMSQLMFDLYGVKVSANAVEMQDHGCLTESLDKTTALEIMDLVLTQVNRISIKDLLKSDLKFTVDKMQQVIMIPKMNNSMARLFNFRLVNNYLRSPLNPYALYRSLRGIGGLCGMPAYDEGSDIASKGWYSLLGHIALAKFRSLKRSSAGSTDDLNISKAFLRHDLEFDTDRWETWYRLGQVFDAMIEEDTTWTADKLDHHMGELADLQRRAIHCYSMALALATRCAEGSFEDTSKMADLCAEFGTRVYASTREPFSMVPFALDEFKRHYNSRAVGMYQDRPFRGMQLYPAWKFASILLRRASIQKPENWV